MEESAQESKSLWAKHQEGEPETVNAALLLFYDLISLIKSFAEKGYNISSFLVWDVVQVNSAPKGAGFFDGNNGMNQHKEEIHDESNDCRPAI